MSPQPDHPVPCSVPSFTQSPEFSSEERRMLLQVAHDAIYSELEGRQISVMPPTPHLAQPRGAFTTIYVSSVLRGCVGYIVPVDSLYRTVAETARSAAFGDLRFESISRDDLPQLEVSLSILSPLQPIRPEEIEIGRHGLLISHNSHRGLLLPQVATEHGWNRDTFLEETCRKAGLPRDAWRHGASIEAFSAEVFGDQGRE
jgi:uncharacterized protein